MRVEGRDEVVRLEDRTDDPSGAASIRDSASLEESGTLGGILGLFAGLSVSNSGCVGLGDSDGEGDGEGEAVYCSPLARLAPARDPLAGVAEDVRVSLVGRGVRLTTRPFERTSVG